MQCPAPLSCLAVWHPACARSCARDDGQTAALRAHPNFYRGMMLANPTLEPAAAVAELERLHGEGFVGVRFNPYLFPAGMDSPVGRALYKRQDR